MENEKEYVPTDEEFEEMLQEERAYEALMESAVEEENEVFSQPDYDI